MNTMLEDFNKVMMGLFFLAVLSIGIYAVYSGFQKDSETFDETLAWCADHARPEACRASVEAHHDVCFDSTYSFFAARRNEGMFNVRIYRECIEDGIAATEK